MKLKLILFTLALLIFFTGIINGQNVLVDVYGFDRDQKVPYLGVNNQLKVVVEGKMCSEFMLTTNNGKIYRDSIENCVFIYNPVSQEKSKISLATIIGRDTIVFKELILKVEPLPMKLTIGPFVTGFDCENTINKELLLSNRFGMESINMNISAYSKILSLEVNVVRSQERIYHRKFNEYNFKTSKELQKDLQMIQPGDFVLLEKIFYRYFEGLDLVVDSIKLKVE